LAFQLVWHFAVLSLNGFPLSPLPPHILFRIRCCITEGAGFKVISPSPEKPERIIAYGLINPPLTQWQNEADLPPQKNKGGLSLPC